MEIQLATFGVWELVLILLIVVVIFGAGKLPQLGESLGKSIRNFRKSFKGEPKEVKGEARRVEAAAKPEELPSGKDAESSEGTETVKSKEAPVEVSSKQD